ncbi:MAG: Pr6Pr family membrane protein [Niabella sp.]|nr:Pr6Pr family membrane protein [Niabella sp.]
MKPEQKTIALIFALLGWFAIIAQFVLMLQNSVTFLSETIIRFFSFFTILTNIMTAVFFTSQAVGKRKYRAGVLTAVTVYITIVGLVYQVLLRHLWAPVGLQKVVDELLHSVIPVLTIVYWYRYEDHRNVLYRQITGWLFYPLAYLSYILVRGYFSGFYPYPFVDVVQLGLRQVLINAFFLFILFGIIAFLFVFVGKYIAPVSHAS